MVAGRVAEVLITAGDVFIIIGEGQSADIIAGVAVEDNQPSF
jgi:hypothetical protein